MEEKENGMKAQTNILIGIASALLGLSAMLKQTVEPVSPPGGRPNCHVGG
jgi:hypothetical protein